MEFLDDESTDLIKSGIKLPPLLPPPADQETTRKATGNAGAPELDTLAEMAQRQTKIYGSDLDVVQPSIPRTTFEFETDMTSPNNMIFPYMWPAIRSKLKAVLS